MTVQALQTATFVVLGILALIAVVVAVVNSKKENRALAHVVRITTATAVMCAVFAGFIAYSVHDAVAHGAYQLGDTTLPEMLEHTSKVPVEESDKLPDEPKDTLVYMYRYACPDCEDVDGELVKWLDQVDPNWIALSSRSDRGSQVRKEVGVDEVPALIYFDRDGKPVWKVAYKKSDDGEHAVLDMEALDYIEGKVSNG